MFSGSMVAIATPMCDDGGIDWAAWERLLDFHLQAGTAGIVVAGTTGESASLERAEIVELTRRAVAYCRGRVPVIAGAGTHSTADTVARVRELSGLGVDGLLLVTPYYNKPPQEGLFRHFSAAAEASGVPIILYNVPSRTAVDLLPATLARLARHPRVVAVKEALGSMERGRQIVEACPPDFVLLSGDDATHLDLMGVGSKGVISVTANVAPRQMSEACAAAAAGDFARARQIDSALSALHRDLFVEANPIPVKWALAQMGLIGNAIRLPLVELSAAHRDTVRRAMQIAELKLEGRAA
ncbi:MAG: 4-hydroxy-tetrahydrodipicolinate synthase [Proteobacteria bacterium]|nr:4-hydroxy-tetrahydrodipicolinate synthase [Pseudomonadota bacterium]